MDHGRTSAASPAARLTGDLRRRALRLGPRVLVAIIAGVVLLAVTVAATWAEESASPTRITLTMPCSRVDSGTVGRSAYGLDEVLSASCSPVSAHR